MMRLKPIEPDETTGKTKEIFQKLVMAPNVMCIMANSEPVLDIYAQFHSNLSSFKLSEKYRKMISLAVSQFNDCQYCVALHTSTATLSGILTTEECIEARQMKSTEPKADALLKFTGKILETQGKVDNDSLTNIRNQGFDNQQIIEIIAVISFINLANLTANIGEPELDFPHPPEIR